MIKVFLSRLLPTFTIVSMAEITACESKDCVQRGVIEFGLGISTAMDHRELRNSQNEEVGRSL